jgi:hypothetical protein
MQNLKMMLSAGESDKPEILYNGNTIKTGKLKNASNLTNVSHRSQSRHIRANATNNTHLIYFHV